MKTNSKTSLFLMELIIVILFFSIASVVCVQLFVNAYSTNESTKRTTQGTVIVQGLAEQFLGCDGDLSAVSALYDAAYTDTDTAKGTLTIGYDADWTEVSADTAPVYTAGITITDENGAALPEDAFNTGGTMMVARIDVSDASSGELIASQEVKHYVPYRLEETR
ncbi:hypothetical protein SAMN02910292_00371 [Lachnospiraceae bacterium XBB2008]|nr:hypothetical protein SAMN02910292_00371 [Lachnospiraceae bacterium XBB2008]